MFYEKKWLARKLAEAASSRRLGRQFSGASSKPILGVVRQVRRELVYSCASGYFGTCEVKGLGGIPDHREEVLSPSEKAANGSMMICVGRSRTTKLIVDR
jgi:ferredoxin